MEGASGQGHLLSCLGLRPVCPSSPLVSQSVLALAGNSSRSPAGGAAGGKLGAAWPRRLMAWFSQNPSCGKLEAAQDGPSPSEQLRVMGNIPPRAAPRPFPQAVFLHVCGKNFVPGTHCLSAHSLTRSVMPHPPPCAQTCAGPENQGGLAARVRELRRAGRLP